MQNNNNNNNKIVNSLHKHNQNFSMLLSFSNWKQENRDYIAHILMIHSFSLCVFELLPQLLQHQSKILPYFKYLYKL